MSEYPDDMPIKSNKNQMSEFPDDMPIKSNKN